MTRRIPNFILINLSEGTPEAVQPKDGDVIALVQINACGQLRQVFFPKEHFTQLSPRELTDMSAQLHQQGLILLGAARYTKVGGDGDLNISIKDMHGNPTVPADWDAIHVVGETDAVERPRHFVASIPKGIV